MLSSGAANRPKNRQLHAVGLTKIRSIAYMFNVADRCHLWHQENKHTERKSLDRD